MESLWFSSSNAMFPLPTPTLASASAASLATAVLIAGGLASLEWAVFKLKGPEDSLLIAHVRVLAWLHARALYGFKIHRRGPDPIPGEGPFILVANHRSGADPVLLSLVTQRRVRFLMAREYYDLFGLRWLFRRLGAIPVNRDGRDLSATKEALRALRQGDGIGVFPQGGIRDASVEADEAKAGVALLALKTGAPVVPYYVHGTPETDSIIAAFLRPAKATITCGETIPARRRERLDRKPSRDELNELTERIWQSIAALGQTPTHDSEMTARS